MYVSRLTLKFKIQSLSENDLHTISSHHTEDLGRLHTSRGRHVLKAWRSVVVNAGKTVLQAGPIEQFLLYRADDKTRNRGIPHGIPSVIYSRFYGHCDEQLY